MPFFSSVFIQWYTPICCLFACLVLANCQHLSHLSFIDFFSCLLRYLNISKASISTLLLAQHCCVFLSRCGRQMPAECFPCIRLERVFLGWSRGCYYNKSALVTWLSLEQVRAGHVTVIITSPCWSRDCHCNKSALVTWLSL